MIHPHVELIKVNDAIGYGLFAKNDIPEGTVTWVQDKFDQVIPETTYKNFSHLEMQTLEKYAYLNQYNDYIVCWDLGKYINHNCNPNILSTGFEFDIAIRDIKKGEEIVTDYAVLNLEEAFTCQCGSHLCRKTITSEYAGNLVPQWDEKIKQAFTHFQKVEQPLWPWIKEKEKVEQSLQTNNYPSANKNLLPKNNQCK